MNNGWKDILYENKGKLIGIVVGFFIGILIVSLGFIKAIFVLICTFIGFYVGKKKDEREDFLGIIEKFIPSVNSRR